MILRDDVSSGNTYVSDSATLDGITVSPIDLSPFRLRIGAIGAGETRTVSYQLKTTAGA